ncbi:MAG: DNA repair and recombination protein RadA [Thermoprotei archaeon]|nr:MAG: DNA repair and recombination protein RadA [Thermofilum sp. ex4484_79]RLE61517.1 MAG: DNA repair and recombination protein RadA [Thermoprotei archaeon]HDD63906.1 DNA repair and recombination protein RadA [Thermoprotei archaeon]
MPSRKKDESSYEEFRLEDIEGVGRITAEKLRRNGYVTLKDIAYASAHELAQIIGSEDRARTIILYAQKLIGGGRVFITAKEYYEQRQRISLISTGCRSLDELLEGGIETRAITELIGEFGAGKTQICHQLAIMVQLPKDMGGLEAKAVYVDTEGTFRPERVVQIARYRGLDPDIALENIIYARAFNTDHQMLLIGEVKKLIEKENIRLLIVDSLVTHFRSEYPGRENLALRQQKLNKHISQLMRLASIYDVAVVVTNQVVASPDIIFGNPLKPVGGNIMAHGCTYRIWIKKGREGKRIARIIDSPKHAEKEAAFMITEEGVIDL